MSTFSVQASIANPDLLERRLGVELVVDTRATYTLLPAGSSGTSIWPRRGNGRRRWPAAKT